LIKFKKFYFGLYQLIFSSFDRFSTAPIKFSIISTLWLTIEYFLLGPYSFVRDLDTGDHWVPRLIQVGKNFIDHGVTYWIPWMGSGVDRFSNDLLLNYPNQLFFTLLPGWIAYALIMILIYFFSIYFTYILCHNILGLSNHLSAFSSLYYAILIGNNGFLQFQFSFVTFPLLLFLLDKLWEKYSNNNIYWFLLFLLSILYGYTSSLPHTLPFISILIVLWFGLIRRKNSFKFWFSLFVFLSIGFFSHLQNAWAIMTNFPTSHRLSNNDYSFLSLLNNYSQVQNFIFRQIYYYSLYIIMFVISVFYSGFKNKKLNKLIILFCITAFATPISLFIMALIFPIISLEGIYLDRLYEFAPFFAAIGCGYILSEINFNNKSFFLNQKSITSISLIVIFLISTQMKIAHAQDWIIMGSYSNRYKTNPYKNISNNLEKDKLFRVATFARGLHPAYANAYGLETIDGYINLYPKRYKKYWSKVIEPITKRVKSWDIYFNNWGNRVYLFPDYLNQDEINFNNYFNLNLLSLGNTKYIISRLKLKHDFLVQIDKGVDFYKLNKIQKIQQMISENFSGRTIYLYQNNQVLPRFFLVPKIRYFDNLDSLLNTLAITDIEELHQTAFIEDDYVKMIGNLSNNIKGLEDQNILVNSYTPDEINISVQGIYAPLVLITTNSFSPFWKCYINGEKRPIFPTYGTFWGIVVRPGDNSITFRYEPPYATF